MAPPPRSRISPDDLSLQPHGGLAQVPQGAPGYGGRVRLVTPSHRSPGGPQTLQPGLLGCMAHT